MRFHTASEKLVSSLRCRSTMSSLLTFGGPPLYASCLVRPSCSRVAMFRVSSRSW